MIATDIPEGVRNRAQACLLGQVAGDSLGSLVEFKNASTIRALYRNSACLTSRWFLFVLS